MILDNPFLNPPKSKRGQKSILVHDLTALVVDATVMVTQVSFAAQMAFVTEYLCISFRFKLWKKKMKSIKLVLYCTLQERSEVDVNQMCNNSPDRLQN